MGERDACRRHVTDRVMESMAEMVRSCTGFWEMGNMSDEDCMRFPFFSICTLVFHHTLSGDTIESTMVTRTLL